MKNFDALIGVGDWQWFAKNHYGKSPVILPHDDGWFEQTFGIDALNHILNFVPLSYPRVRVTDHQNSIHKFDLIDDRDRYANNRNDELNPEKLVRAIARGSTLVVDRIELFHKPLENFIDGLAHDLGVRMACNAYYSTHHSVGVNAHFDRHDVFAVQVHGCKRWYFRNAPHVLSKPIRGQQSPHVNETRAGWNSVLLKKGDVFYCPRGLWHFTETGDEPSAHIAIGLYPLTLQDWINRLCQQDHMPELLEQYVSTPFELTADQQPGHLLDLLFEELRKASQNPLSFAPNALRPHIELE